MYASSNIGVGVDAFAVTPSNTVNFPTKVRAVYVGVGGDVSLQVKSGAVVFKNVSAGTLLDIECIRVNVTGTTAASIVGVV